MPAGGACWGRAAGGARRAQRDIRLGPRRGEAAGALTETGHKLASEPACTAALPPTPLRLAGHPAAPLPSVHPASLQAAGEVQWAAFFSDCLHEVLPVTDGARVTLAWELFAYPGAPHSWQPGCANCRPGACCARRDVQLLGVVCPLRPGACCARHGLQLLPQSCAVPTRATLLLPSSPCARWSPCLAANAAQLPAQAASLPNGADSLLHALRKALDSNSFLVNGGRLGFPLQVRTNCPGMPHSSLLC